MDKSDMGKITKDTDPEYWEFVNLFSLESNEYCSNSCELLKRDGKECEIEEVWEWIKSKIDIAYEEGFNMGKEENNHLKKEITNNK